MNTCMYKQAVINVYGCLQCTHFCLKTEVCIVMVNFMPFNFTVMYKLCKRVQNKSVGQDIQST